MHGKNLKEALQDVVTMMIAFGQKVRSRPTTRVSMQEKKLRIALIEEETCELIHAIECNKLDEIADGIIDVIVVTLGTAATYGIPVDTIWDEIMKTNMVKAGGPKDPVTGKTLKPSGWIPPNIKKLLKKAGSNDT